MAYPFVAARHYYSSRNSPIRVFVVHTAEVAETPTSAEAVANYFKTTDRTVSAHLVGDEDSIIQCVKYEHTAFAAPGVNADGIQFELCGRAAQTPAEWDDEYSRKALNLMAMATRTVCGQFGIPIRHLSNAQLAAGEKGIIGHVQASQVYKKSTHTDPGPNFPWDRFISLAAGQEEDMTATESQQLSDIHGAVARLESTRAMELQQLKEIHEGVQRIEAKMSSATPGTFSDADRALLKRISDQFT